MLNEAVVTGTQSDRAGASRAAWVFTGEVPRWLIVSVLICVAAGSWYRFSSLSTKYVYRDEVKTSMHVAGYTLADVRRLDAGAIMSAGSLVARYEQPHAGRTAADTVRVLAQTDPQHPPLYYLLARAWQERFGDSVTARRAISAIFGVLVIPAMFWLALVLFRSPRAAWLAAGLSAVSPYQFLYAQQIREWSLFVLLMVTSTALLVRALERNSRASWILYGICSLTMMYCAILSLIVVAAHALYVVLERRSCARNFLVAAGIALVAYAPWLAQMFLRWNQSMDETAYTAVALPAALYLAKIVFALGTVFFDAEYASLRLAVVALAALAVGAYAVLHPIFDRRLKEAGLPLALIAVNLGVFLIADAALHGSRAAQERYLLAAAVGMELLTAYALTRPTANAIARRASNAAAIFLLCAGLGSVWVAHARASWWDNNDAATMGAAARIATSAHSIVFFDDSFAALLFSNVAPPDTELAFRISAARGSGRPILALYSSPSALEGLRRATGTAGTPVKLDTGPDALHSRVIRAHGGDAGDRTVAWMFAR